MTTRRGSWGRRLLLALAVLLGVLLCALLVLWLLARQASAIWPRDATPIALPEPTLPVEEGAWADCLALTRQLDKQDLAWLAEAIAAKGPPPTESLARWREHEPALQAMDKLVGRSGLRGPILEIDDELPPALPVLHVARLRLLRAWWHAAQGDPRQASEDLQATQRLGMLLEQAGSSLLLTVVGLSVQDSVVDETDALLRVYPGWPADALAPLAQSLVAASTHPSGMLAALAAECLAQERLLRRMAGMSTWELLRQTGELQSRGEASRAPNSSGGSWFFDVDATAGMARQRCHRRLDEAARPTRQRQPLDEPRLWQGGAWTAVALLDNPVGRILLDIAQPSTGRFMERSDRVRARRALLGLRLAILAFAGVHEGSRPGALRDLVPEVVPALPLDPFTGESLVYDREAGTLTSAGSDDDGPLGARLDEVQPGSAPASAP